MGKKPELAALFLGGTLHLPTLSSGSPGGVLGAGRCFHQSCHQGPSLSMVVLSVAGTQAMSPWAVFAGLPSRWEDAFPQPQSESMLGLRQSTFGDRAAFPSSQ